MAARDSKALKTSALVVALTFLFCVSCSATGYFFFGSSKIRPLFGMSAEALGGERVDPRAPRPKSGWVNQFDAGR